MRLQLCEALSFGLQMAVWHRVLAPLTEFDFVCYFLCGYYFSLSLSLSVLCSRSFFLCLPLSVVAPHHLSIFPLSFSFFFSFSFSLCFKCGCWSLSKGGRTRTSLPEISGGLSSPEEIIAVIKSVVITSQMNISDLSFSGSLPLCFTNKLTF